MKSVFLIVCALFLLFALPKVFSLIDEARSDELTVNYAGITTGSGEYTSNFTLPKALYYSSLVSVKEISSNITGADAPSAFSYNTVSRLLTISGLDQDQIRTISVKFLVSSVTIETFMLDVMGLLRWLYLLIIFGTATSAVWSFFTN